MALAPITAKELRIFAMDKAELNSLVDGVKYSDEDIEQAQINIVDRFNLLPPPTGYNYKVENFPNRHLMLLGVWGHLLRGAAIGESANQFQYSAGGVDIDDKNHAQVFAAMGQQFMQEFDQFAKDYKISQNIVQCYGTNNSEYRRYSLY